MLSDDHIDKICRFGGNSARSLAMDHRHFFGDSVAGTLIRLVLLSIVVGIIFSALGINPGNIVEKLQLLVQRLTSLGFDTVKWALGYFLLGAVVVFPIWFIVRLMRASKPRDRA